MTCANQAAPLLLAWYNITVSVDNRAVSRGIELAIGTPPLSLSLRPSISDNNTFVFNAADCVSASNDTCIGNKGGVFDPHLSSTYQKAPRTTWNGTQGPEIDTGAYIFFNDDLYLGNGITSFGFPAFMDQYGQGTQSGLGLGAGSTFLNATVSSGAAPSTSWGLWTGSRSVSHPVDGLLVIGGYDTARVQTEFTTFQSFHDCITCVEVTNLTYVYPGGSVSLFSNSSEILQVSLDPFERGLKMPQDIFDNFLVASKGYFDPSQYLIAYPTSAPPLGNLSITLQNGLQNSYETTIITEELFTLPRTYDSQGQYSISNNSILVSQFKNGSDPRYVPTWGFPFLTMNYMIMDYDQGHFKMAPAYRQDFGPQGGALIQPLCSGLASTTITPTSLPTTSGSIASNTPSPGPPTSSPTPPSHNTNTGAIAGGVVGGVVGLAIICALIFMLFRQRRRSPDRNTAEAQRGGATEPETSHKDLAAERLSSYTATSPTEYSELESSGKKEDQAINHWLTRQNQMDENVMSPTIDKPFEMPASHHDQ